MSDKVIFTKEEVEKIKTALWVACTLMNNMPCYTEAIAFLDSPRPRPALPIRMLLDARHSYDEMPEYSAKDAMKEIADANGFDVED